MDIVDSTRLDSILTDLEIRRDESSNRVIKEELEKDIKVMREVLDYFSAHFDVAKWMREDILNSLNDEQEKLLNDQYDSKDAFVDDVIECLGNQFDAQYGINWDTIEIAVNTVLK